MAWLSPTMNILWTTKRGYSCIIVFFLLFFVICNMYDVCGGCTLWFLTHGTWVKSCINVFLSFTSMLYAIRWCLCWVYTWFMHLALLLLTALLRATRACWHWFKTWMVWLSADSNNEHYGSLHAQLIVCF